MKSHRLACLLSVSFASILVFWSCGAQDLVYETSKANAIARAKQEGKMILADFGREACANCQAMLHNFEKTSPPLKQWLQASCVLWRGDIDSSTDWRTYTGGADAGTLPLLCLVDPHDPENTIMMLGGYIPVTTFLYYLQTRAKQYLPLVVTNLPAGPLTSRDFLVQGIAQTDVRLIGSITGAPIERIMWRLNGVGAFQPATGTTVWSAPVSLARGTNVFESYVQYAGPQNSWTNRVTLINLGIGKSSLTIAAKPRTKTYGTVLDLGTTAFTVSGLEPGDAVTSVTLTASGGTGAAGSVGNYTIQPSAASGTGGFPANYEITYLPGTLTVGKALLTVTAGNATRRAGAPDPAFTYQITGFVNGENATVVSGSPSLTTTATTISPPGSYPITAAPGTLSALNYAFTFANGTLTVTSAVPGDTNNDGTVDQAELRAVLATMDASNYTFTLVQGKLTVVPKVPGDTNNDGNVDRTELNAVLSMHWTTSPPEIASIAITPQTNFTFSVTDAAGADLAFRVQFTTDLANPSWQEMGLRFIDPNVGRDEQRYYRLVAP